MEPGGLAWVDGAVLSRDEARISVDDFGFRYGLTCFETMLARSGRVFRLDAHLERLDASLRLFRVEPPSHDTLRRAVAETLEANHLADAAVRLSVSPGVGGRPALPAAGPPSIVVTVAPIGDPPNAVRLWVCEGVRLDSARSWREAKVGQFAPYLLARLEAEDRGADDGLLLNERGHIVEAATANLFVERDDQLLTPPLDDGPLPGVTRAAIIEVAQALGVPVVETPVLPGEIEGWQSAFVTSSVAGIVPVSAVTWEGDGVGRGWRPALIWRPIDEIRRAYERMVDIETH